MLKHDDIQLRMYIQKTYNLQLYDKCWEKVLINLKRDIYTSILSSLDTMPKTDFRIYVCRKCKTILTNNRIYLWCPSCKQVSSNRDRSKYTTLQEYSAESLKKPIEIDDKLYIIPEKDPKLTNIPNLNRYQADRAIEWFISASIKEFDRAQLQSYLFVSDITCFNTIKTLVLMNKIKKVDTGKYIVNISTTV